MAPSGALGDACLLRPFITHRVHDGEYDDWREDVDRECRRAKALHPRERVHALNLATKHVRIENEAGGAERPQESMDHVVHGISPVVPICAERPEREQEGEKDRSN